MIWAFDVHINNKHKITYHNFMSLENDKIDVNFTFLWDRRYHTPYDIFLKREITFLYSKKGIVKYVSEI